MHERGSALLIIMWVIFLVGLIVLGVGYQLELDTALSHEFREECRARSQAESILNWAILQLQNDTGEADTPAEFQFEPEDYQADLGPVQGKLLILDEGSRVNLNTAPEKLLKTIFKRYGAENALAPLLDWRDPDNLPRDGGAEEPEYAGESPPTIVRNGSLPVVQEFRKVKNAETAWERLSDEITVYGPAILWMMDKEVLINLLRESGTELDDLQAVEIMQGFERMRKEDQLRSLDDLSRVHPMIGLDKIAKLKRLIRVDGTFNPNFLTQDRMRALLALWNIEPPLETKVLNEVFEERSAFENAIRGMKPDLTSREIWSVFTLESRIWRVRVSVKTAFRTLILEAVVRRDREGAGERWKAEILEYRATWQADKEAKD